MADPVVTPIVVRAVVGTFIKSAIGKDIGAGRRRAEELVRRGLVPTQLDDAGRAQAEQVRRRAISEPGVVVAQAGPIVRKGAELIIKGKVFRRAIKILKPKPIEEIPPEPPPKPSPEQTGVIQRTVQREVERVTEPPSNRPLQRDIIPRAEPKPQYGPFRERLPDVTPQPVSLPGNLPTAQVPKVPGKPLFPALLIGLGSAAGVGALVTSAQRGGGSGISIASRLRQAGSPGPVPTIPTPIPLPPTQEPTPGTGSFPIPSAGVGGSILDPDLRSLVASFSGVGTDAMPGLATETAPVREKTKTGSKVAECQIVKRRRRRKGKCREGFFNEMPGSTKYTTWRVKDCETGKTIQGR